ncbi:NAD(P)-dependent alcohol dehydrogenase [Sediminivirga luteola]|uniref:NADPH:quinone reductase n=1 Tax=Sediminivirga luteola TaxID=1774748 RepID=A0A8J2XI26_9MICO|nr:NAD(P)-dependent alcohol dehydrogenase [Sediminivirga luteola]GGA02622.1 NADPH:quinone reductase [Sediminivirga luteola]
MKAIVHDRYGGPEVLRLTDRTMPVPGPEEVVVRVVAAGVDAGVVHLLEGRPFPVRMALPLRGPRVLGTDVAGVVHAVGERVTEFRPGDEVFGVCPAGGDGSFAEYARTTASKLALKPRRLSFHHAAAIPVSATTALQAVRDAAAVRAGQRVLVLGTAGGVGHFAVQIADAAGARVTGACSTAKMAVVRDLGAETVIDYTAEDPLHRGPFDVIIDTGGHRSLRSLRRALAPRGTLVLVGSEPEGAPLGGMGRSMLAGALNPFSRQRLVMLASAVDRDALTDLSALAEAGKLAPTVTATLPLDRTAEAIRRLGRGHGTGKTVIAVEE